MYKIQTPCWFSTVKDQAINHLCYRNYSSKGLLLEIDSANEFKKELSDLKLKREVEPKVLKMS